MSSDWAPPTIRYDPPLRLLALAPLRRCQRVVPTAKAFPDIAGGRQRDPSRPGDLPKRGLWPFGDNLAGRPPPLGGVQWSDPTVPANPSRGSFDSATEAPPDAADGAGGQPGDGSDHPVRAIGLLPDDPLGGRLTIRKAQRQPVRAVGRDRDTERILLTAVEEPHLNLSSASQLRDTQPVHAIDDTHARAVHEDRRQGRLRSGQQPDVLVVLAR
jgi:hypothetical protein